MTSPGFEDRIRSLLAEHPEQPPARVIKDALRFIEKIGDSIDAERYAAPQVLMICDPESADAHQWNAYGPFDTHEEADAFAASMRAEFPEMRITKMPLRAGERRR